MRPAAKLMELGMAERGGPADDPAVPDPIPPEVPAAAAAFDVPGRLMAAAPFLGGHIHRSYLVTFDEGRASGIVRHPGQSDRKLVRYLLQRLNTAVFPRPQLIMENLVRVSGWRIQRLAEVWDRHRRVVAAAPTRAGQLFHTDANGGCWRLLVFIERTRSILSVETAAQAEAAARAFGEFQVQLADLPPPCLHETIPNFHNTPLRLAAFERAVAADACGRVRDVRTEIDALRRRAPLADVLLELHRQGQIPERIAHNDAKISNVLFDETSGEALCVVDLDTVMPGLSLYDFGDMVRSMSCTAAEDEPDCTRVAVAPELFAALARGYLRATQGMLTPAERAHLVTAGELITYEQAVRFLTDYLCGDTYYRTDPARPAHNLQRCRTQLELLESMGRQATELDRAARQS